MAGLRRVVISSGMDFLEAREWQRQIRGESRRIDRDISRMRLGHGQAAG